MRFSANFTILAAETDEERAISIKIWSYVNCESIIFALFPLREVFLF